VQRYELTGEASRRIAALELPRSEAAHLPDGERVYLDQAGAEPALLPLHPLVLYDAEAEAALFLNSRRGRQWTEYLCYTTGQVIERADTAAAQGELLAGVLGLTVAEGQVAAWAAHSQAEEDVAAEPAGEVGQRLGRSNCWASWARAAWASSTAPGNPPWAGRWP
jgi:hypothetical protein